MDKSSILQLLSFGVGVFGIIVAIIQGFERRKIKQFIHSQSWHIFSITNLSFGAAQSALNAYKDAHKENLDLKIFEQLSKCDAYNVSLFMEAIRQIQLSEPKITLETIAMWVAQGRINDKIAEHFKRSIAVRSPSLTFLIWNAATLRIRESLVKRIYPQKHKTGANNNGKPK